VLERRERRLLKDQNAVPLGARAFDLLCALVERSGQLVTKQELFDAVWSGLVVEENNLQVHISTLRRVLGADSIATVPGRGYRFTAAVNIQAAQTLAQTSTQTPTQTPVSAEGDAQAMHRANVAAAEHLTEPASLPVPLSATLRDTAMRRTVAVLPLANLGGDAEQEYFSDGVAEDIISHLTKSPWVLVVARNSSFRYRNTTTSIDKVGLELGARYVVNGSVRRAGNTIRLKVELVDCETRAQVWSERYDRPITDLFDVQEKIASQVVSVIEPVYLRHEENVSGKLDSQDLQHWDMVMRARWNFWRSTKEHTLAAQNLLNQALALKPDHPASLSLLAFTHLSAVWGNWSRDPRGTLAEAHRLALQAVRNDDTDAFAHFTFGTVLSCINRMDLAIAELQRALVLYPQFAAAAGELGRLLAFSGRSEEACEYVLQAMDASPHDPHLSLWVRSRAIACFVQGNYSHAVHYATDATAKRPDWFFNHLLLAACHAAAGDSDAARASMAHAQINGPYPKAAMEVGHPFTQAEHRERFVRALLDAGWNPEEQSRANAS
jgi:TolB-like protein/DNA-binding winged helix-turn-helix (wHTH) protein/Tfp pilus assembly protein PilF